MAVSLVSFPSPVRNAAGKTDIDAFPAGVRSGYPAVEAPSKRLIEFVFQSFGLS